MGTEILKMVKKLALQSKKSGKIRTRIVIGQYLKTGMHGSRVIVNFTI
jgi:hypothetical protein